MAESQEEDIELDAEVFGSSACRRDGVGHVSKEEKIVQLADQPDAKDSRHFSGVHTKGAMGLPLVVVYWNVAGMPFKK